MKMPNISGLINLGKAFTMAHRPEILLGASIVGTGAAVIAAAHGGYKARGIVDAAQLEKAEPLTTKEKVQLTWICYLPAAGLTAGALGATVGLHIVHIKEKKALAATALMAIEEVKKEAKEYEKALHENGITVKDDEKSLEAAADKDGIAKVLGTDGEIEELYLVRDSRTGRDIWSNEQRIQKAILECNEELQKNGDCDLGYFYTYAGYGLLPDDGELGWSGEKVSISWKNNVRDDGRPVREFTFRPKPKLGHQSRA